METPTEVLGPDGPLASRVPGFVPRDGQQAMAERIARTIADGGRLVAESGTGTGKTFAYLVPALLSGARVVISTGTRNLQDQLFHKDLPLVREALGRPVRSALLKGRSNYLCLHRLEIARDGAEPVMAERLARLADFARNDADGDIAGVTDIPEGDPVWPRVTSTTDNCLGTRCDYYDKCFVNRARREALGAELLVINHHLFFADLVLREDGFGRLLPGVDAVIFDEAHQLPGVATTYFGSTLSANQLLALCRDAIHENLREKSGIANFGPQVEGLRKAIRDFRLVLGDPRRAPLESLGGNAEFRSALETLSEHLHAVTGLLDAAESHGEGLAQCARRASEYQDRLAVITGEDSFEQVRWLEVTPHGFMLHVTPLDTAPAFRGCLDEQPGAWIFTSATLAVDRRFDHFSMRLGLEDADTELWESPFDYPQQALLYLPPGLPQPSHPAYTEKVVAAALPVLRASGGRAFFLFTSHRALRAAAQMLDDGEFNLLVQGEAPRAELVERFRVADRAVLLGTASFWEGIDVRGEALSCVIIDKLPFEAPSDPVLRARGAALEQAGINPFRAYQLPNAVIALKQGVGRLIRDVSDRGVMVLCDPRLKSANYGRIFLDSLPPMRRTAELGEVEAFFDA